MTPLLDSFSTRRMRMKTPFSVRTDGVASSTLPNGLVAYWKMNNGAIADCLAADFGAYSLTKTSNTLAEATGGIIGGKAYKLDTKAGYLYENTGALANLEQFSWVSWMRLPEFAGGYGALRTVNYVGAYNYSIWRARIVASIASGNNNYVCGCFYRDSVGDDDFSLKTFDLSSSAGELQNWHMACLRFDGTTLFADFITNAGHYKNSEAVSTALPTHADFDLFVWYPPTNLGCVAHGDGFGVWNRSITDAEVLELWNGGAGIEHPFIAI